MDRRSGQHPAGPRLRAWTSTRPAPPTAPSSTCTPATAPARRSGYPQSNGELLNPNSGKCLDDTGFGGSGTQVQIWACADSSNQQWTLPSGGPPPGNTPNFGSNVYVFTTCMSTTTIQSDINAVYNTQQSNQFGTQRYELMFEPGTYNVSVPVGFYTEVVGLGQNPTQTVITGGGIYANAAWNDGNATDELLARRGEHHHRPVVRQHRVGGLAGRPDAPGANRRQPRARRQHLGQHHEQLVVRRLHQRLGRHRPGQLGHPAAVHHAQRPAGQLDRLELEHGVRRRHRRARRRASRARRTRR